MMDEQVTHSSGNVFADLDIPDAEDYQAKAELAAQVHRLIKARRLTQRRAGELLGIGQPKVSELLRGRLDGFSTERLLRFLTLLGCDVQISVSPPHPSGRGRVLITGM